MLHIFIPSDWIWLLALTVWVCFHHSKNHTCLFPFTMSGDIHRFQELGCGHIVGGEGTLFSLTQGHLIYLLENNFYISQGQWLQIDHFSWVFELDNVFHNLWGENWRQKGPKTMLLGNSEKAKHLISQYWWSLRPCTQAEGIMGQHVQENIYKNKLPNVK